MRRVCLCPADRALRLSHDASRALGSDVRRRRLQALLLLAQHRPQKLHLLAVGALERLHEGRRVGKRLLSLRSAGAPRRQRFGV